MSLSAIKEILEDGSTSEWLKTALQSAIKRDCVDAANDAEILYQLLDKRCKYILTQD